MSLLDANEIQHGLLEVARSLDAGGLSKDETGGTVGGVTEALMGITAALCRVADSLSEIAEAIRETSNHD